MDENIIHDKFDNNESDDTVVGNNENSNDDLHVNNYYFFKENSPVDESDEDEEASFVNDNVDVSTEDFRTDPETKQWWERHYFANESKKTENKKSDELNTPSDKSVLTSGKSNTEFVSGTEEESLDDHDYFSFIKRYESDEPSSDKNKKTKASKDKINTKKGKEISQTNDPKLKKIILPKFQLKRFLVIFFAGLLIVLIMFFAFLLGSKMIGKNGIAQDIMTVVTKKNIDNLYGLWESSNGVTTYHFNKDKTGLIMEKYKFTYTVEDDSIRIFIDDEIKANFKYELSDLTLTLYVENTDIKYTFTKVGASSSEKKN